MRDVRGRLPTPHYSSVVDWDFPRREPEAEDLTVHFGPTTIAEEAEDLTVHFSPTTIAESGDEQSPSASCTSLKASRCRKRRHAFHMDMQSQLGFMLQVQNDENESGSDTKILRSSRDRVPTPFEHTLPSNLVGVRFNDCACVERGHQIGLSLEAPSCSRVTSRKPTPYEFTPPPEIGVRFGLTSELGRDTEDGDVVLVPSRRNDRQTTPTLPHAAALASTALTERAPTPRSSHVRLGGIFGDDPDHIPVDRKAFQDKLPNHHCSATEECAICHECFGAEEAKMFPCGHFYHADCILQWLERQLTCPLCRRSFAPEIGNASPNPALEQLLDEAQPTTVQRSWSV